MKQNNRSILDTEVDLRKILIQLWKEKILILFVCLAFMVVGYVYGTFQPKIYKTEIIIRYAPSFLFEPYRSFLNLTKEQQQQQDIATLFNNEFKFNLLSLDNITQFVEKNNEIGVFKSYLNKENIDARKYFKERLKLVPNQENNIANRYSLTFQKPLPGEQFLNGYIIFIKQQTMEIFKQQLTQMIVNEINVHKQNLVFAEIINLENPILKSMNEGNTNYNSNESAPLFYKGTKVLSQKLFYLNQLLNQTKDLTLAYDPILEKASVPSLISTSNPSLTFAAIGFLLGVFLSLIIILISFVKK